MIAAQRALMRLVDPKSEDQPASAVLSRAAERLVHQRTGLVHALRGMLDEYGHVVQQGIGQLRRVKAIFWAEFSGLPALVRVVCRALLAQIGERTARIDTMTRTARDLAAQADTDDSGYGAGSGTADRAGGGSACAGDGELSQRSGLHCLARVGLPGSDWSGVTTCRAETHGCMTQMRREAASCP